MSTASILYHIPPKLTKETDQTLRLMIQHEHEMAKLYTVLADKIEECEKFWRHVAVQEIRHMHLLEDLAEEVQLAKATVADDPKRRRALRISLQSLTPRIHLWGSHGVAKGEAFRYALVVEGGMIERCTFALGMDDSSHARQVLRTLTKETKGHVEEIRAATRRHGSSFGFFWRCWDEFVVAFGH